MQARDSKGRFVKATKQGRDSKGRFTKTKKCTDKCTCKDNKKPSLLDYFTKIADGSVIGNLVSSMAETPVTGLGAAANKKRTRAKKKVKKDPIEDMLSKLEKLGEYLEDTEEELMEDITAEDCLMMSVSMLLEERGIELTDVDSVKVSIVVDGEAIL